MTAAGARMVRGSLDLVLPPVEVPGQEQDEADLGQLGRLETDPAEADPAVRLGHGRHQEAQDEQAERQGQQAEDEQGLLVERLPDRKQHEQDEPTRRSRPIACWTRK